MSSTSTQLFPISVHATEPGLTSKEAGPVALTGPQPVPPVIWSPKLTESAAMDPGSSCVLTLDTPLPTHPAMVDTVIRVGFNAVWLVVDGWLRVGAWTQSGGTLWSLSADLGGEGLDAESGFDPALTAGTWTRVQLVVSDDQLVLLVNGHAAVRIPVGERFTVPTTITSVTLQATDATRQLQVGVLQLTDDVPATVETSTSTAERIGLGEVRGAFHRVGKETIGGEWGAETAIPGGRFQPYEFGAAYWSPSTGAVTVEGPVWERYAQMGTHASVLGRPLTDTQQGTARYATRTRDALATRGGDQSLMTRFEHGVIAWAEHTGAHEVVGRVAAHWLVLGGPASVVGLPTGPPTETARGYRHGFEFGEVFERYDGTVAEVHGGILERYDKLGLWDGPLGAPMTDETKVLADDGTDTGIRTNRFEHGAIYWTAASGAHELLDPWHAAYLEAGGAAGPLGLATSPVRSAGTLGVEYVEFEHGLMVRTPTMAPRLVDTVEVVLTEATAPSIDDGIEIDWDGISADRTAELMVWMSVLRNGEPVEGFDRKRFPDSGHASKHIDMHNVRVQVPVDATTTITVIGAAEDWDTWDDDALGGILRNYGIDTLWGELPAGGAYSETGSGGDGDVIYKYAIGLPAGPISPIFREHRWWQFTNGGTDDVSYPEYAQAFEDVEAHGSWWDTVTNPLDHLFYELAIRNVAEDGNCYGMSSLALRTIMDETQYRLPLTRYGPVQTKVSDGAFPDAIRTELNIHHCQQLDSAVLGSILSRISLGPILNLRIELTGIGDGSTGDLAVISMVSILEGKGHAVLAYGYEPRPGFPDSILVADPNVPFAKTNAAHASRIEIDNGGGWQFFDDGKAHADYSSGAGCAAVPAPLARRQRRVDHADGRARPGRRAGRVVVRGRRGRRDGRDREPRRGRLADAAPALPVLTAHADVCRPGSGPDVGPGRPGLPRSGRRGGVVPDQRGDRGCAAVVRGPRRDRQGRRRRVRRRAADAARRRARAADRGRPADRVAVRPGAAGRLVREGRRHAGRCRGRDLRLHPARGGRGARRAGRRTGAEGRAAPPGRRDRVDLPARRVRPRATDGAAPGRRGLALRGAGAAWGRRRRHRHPGPLTCAAR